MKPLLTKAEFNGIEVTKLDSDKQWNAYKALKYMSQIDIVIQDPTKSVKIQYLDRDGNIERE